MGCQIEVPASVMHHVVKVESSYNPYAIGVVRGRLARQPRNLGEAVATAEMLEARGFNFSLGLAQVNRYNLTKYGLASYSAAFQTCANLRAGSQILRECHSRASGDWAKAFSCYYSGNFTTGFRQGYVQKVQRSMLAQRAPEVPTLAIPVVDQRSKVARQSPVTRATAEAPTRATGQASQIRPPHMQAVPSLMERRIQTALPPANTAPEMAQVPPPSQQNAAAHLVPPESTTQEAAPAVALPTIAAPARADIPMRTTPTRARAEDAAFVF